MSNQPHLSWSDEFPRPTYSNFPSHYRSHSASYLDTTRTVPAKCSKPRVSMACKHCRQRKVRCDGGMPSCSLCARLERPCEYIKVTEAENAVLREKKRAARARKTTQASANRGDASAYNHSQSRPYPLARPTSSSVIPVLLRSNQNSSEIKLNVSISHTDYQRQQIRYHKQSEANAHPSVSLWDPVSSSNSSQAMPVPAQPGSTFRPAFQHPGSAAWSTTDFVSPAASSPMDVFDRNPMSSATPVSQYQHSSSYGSPSSTTWTSETTSSHRSYDRRDRPYTSNQDDERRSLEYGYHGGGGGGGRMPESASASTTEYDESPFFRNASLPTASSLPAHLERANQLDGAHSPGLGLQTTFSSYGGGSWNESGTYPRSNSSWIDSSLHQPIPRGATDNLAERSRSWEQQSVATSVGISGFSPEISPSVTEKSLDISSPFMGASIQDGHFSSTEASRLRNFSNLANVNHVVGPVEGYNTASWADNMDLNSSNGRLTLPPILGGSSPFQQTLSPGFSHGNFAIKREDNVFVVDTQHPKSMQDVTNLVSQEVSQADLKMDASHRVAMGYSYHSFETSSIKAER